MIDWIKFSIIIQNQNQTQSFELFRINASKWFAFQNQTHTHVCSNVFVMVQAGLKTQIESNEFFLLPPVMILKSLVSWKEFFLGETQRHLRGEQSSCQNQTPNYSSHSMFLCNDVYWSESHSCLFQTQNYSSDSVFLCNDVYCSESHSCLLNVLLMVFAAWWFARWPLPVYDSSQFKLKTQYSKLHVSPGQDVHNHYNH